MGGRQSWRGRKKFLRREFCAVEKLQPVLLRKVVIAKGVSGRVGAGAPFDAAISRSQASRAMLSRSRLAVI